MNRFYREFHKNEGLIRFVVIEEESDLLFVMSEVDTIRNLEAFARRKILEIRHTIVQHIQACPEFITSLEPLSYEGENVVLKSMYKSGAKAGVGPMAAVAGITSEYVGISFIEKYGNVDIIIENGGDIFINSTKERHIAIYAGDSPLSNQLKLLVTPEMTPLGICTSAGSIGHSLSFGKADAVVILSKDTTLADAVATATGNKVHTPEDIKEAIDFAMRIDGILGTVIIIDDQLGAKGNITFV